MLLRSLALLSILCGASAAAAPFETRDQNPLLAGFGLPAPLPARLAVENAPRGTQRLSVDSAINWGSSAIDQRSAREALTVDAETREARFTLSYPLGKTQLRLQVPYHYIG